MKEHKHAAVLRAIADGVDLDEFECHTSGWKKSDWRNLGDGWIGWFTNPDCWEVRRKQQFITVNGFKVPKPVESVPNKASYFMAEVTAGRPRAADMFNGIETVAAKHCATNTVHLTKEAAMAHAKAMLGMEPGLSTGKQHD